MKKDKIFLCGFMGCGKTYIGIEYADRADIEFADLDRYIADRESMSIPDIFKVYGEEYFRGLEAKYISEMPDKSITALGGGAIINDNTARTAKENGIVVFLDAPFELCYQRIKNDKNRPLAFNKPKAQVRELFDKRHDIYLERADIVIEAGEDAEKTLTELGSRCKEL